jgi:hypothetical protein
MPSAVPEASVVLMVEVLFCPGLSVRLFGLAPIEKSLVTGGGGGGGGVGPLEQLGNLNEPMRVRQLKLPLTERYSFVSQKVQSSDGSTLMLE